MLFNFIHVFLLVGGKDCPIMYVFMFCQIFAFYRVAAQGRLYNSLLSSVFTVLTCIQYFIATGHRFDMSSLQPHEAYIGFRYFNEFFALTLCLLNALSPVIFSIWWSFTMVLKEQAEDDKLKLIIQDIQKDDENTSKDVIVLKKKIILNQVMDFVLRGLFFMFGVYFLSMIIVSKRLVNHS